MQKGWWEQGERDRLNAEAAWELAGELHQLIGAFVAKQGLERLRRLQSQLDDPEWGAKRRNELAQEWEECVEAGETRDVAALVAGRRGEMGRFDPLSLPAIRARLAVDAA